MRTQNIKEYDKAYRPPETAKLDYCAAVLALVLKQHPKAKELFEDIKDSISLPGVQDTFGLVEGKMPSGDKLLKGMVTKAGYNLKSKPDENSAVAGRRLISGAMKLIIGFKNRLYILIILNNRRRKDLKILARSVDNFIRVCFNRESDRAKGACRVTGNTSKTLGMLVFVRALFETDEKLYRIYKRMGKLPMVKHGKKCSMWTRF